MLLSKRFTAILFLLLTGVFAPPAEASGTARAEELFSIGPLPVTNSMVTSWVIALILIIAIKLAVKRPQLVPSRGQAIVETVVEGVYGLIEPIVGKKASKAAFPILVGLFIYILIQNWSGLIPGVGTIGWGESTEHGFHVITPFIRPANADMNGTIALAVIAMCAWVYLIFKYAGTKIIIYDLFGNKADRNEIPALIYYFLFPIFFAVGLIEILSILFRPVSLSFRLFGNVFGGENLLHSMTAISKWGLPIPFYFLEVLIGFVQALVFTLLVSVYIGLICNHGDDHDEASNH